MRGGLRCEEPGIWSFDIKSAQSSTYMLVGLTHGQAVHQSTVLPHVHFFPM